MRVCAIGIGEAGGRIVDELIARAPRGERVVQHAIALNTAKADLMDLERVPESDRVLVGQSRVKGHGVGADCELAMEIFEEDIDEVQEAIDRVPVREIDAFLLVAGLGGGTGAGGAPVLAYHLRRIYTEPVVGLGILPGSDEGGIYTLNAYRTLPQFHETTDGLVLFDNDAWRERGTEPDYDAINRALVDRLRPLLAAPPDAGVVEALTEADGFGTMGYAAEEVETGGEGLLSRFTGSSGPDPDEVTNTNRITSLVRKAALGRLTMPADISDCSHAALLGVGPDAYLSAKGLRRGREWLANETGGTATAHEAPREGAGQVSCVVLLAGFRGTPRLEELETTAEEAEGNIEEIRAETEANLETLVEGDEDLDPLFGEEQTGKADAGDTDDTATTPARAGAATDTGDAGDASGGPSATAHEPGSIPGAPDCSLDYDDLDQGELIGRGGNANVYRATAPGPDGELTIALKEPHLDGTLHTETVERVMDEAETWSKLDGHDHVVGVVAYGADPLPWIAMEYMDGGHLGERIDGMPFEQRLWTAIAVTRAVRSANRRGVAHLDLKPQNVLFRTVDGAWDVPKVADWGLSRHLLEHSTSLDGLSPTYAAPEQFDDEYGPADNITDVYQLGAVFYELFTGRPPFEGSPMEVMRAVATETVTPPSEVAGVPPELDEILGRALSTERARRYEDALQLRNALEALYAEL